MADRLLPLSASALEAHIEQAMARNGEGRELPIDTLWDPARCPAALLPWIAWALGVRRWDATWSVAVRRAVVAASIDLHRREGTRSAIETLLDSLGAVYTITEHPTRAFFATIDVWNLSQIAASRSQLVAMINDVTRLTVISRVRIGASADILPVAVGVWCEAVSVATFEAAA